MKNLVLIIFFLLTNSVFAQQIEIAVSSRVEIKTLTDKEIKKFESEDNLDHFTSRTGIVLRKEREFLQRFKNQIQTSYHEIVTQLGKNSDIRFVKEYDPSTTNFILRIKIAAMFKEIPLDVNVEGSTIDNGDFMHGKYWVRTIFELHDPHTNTTVTMFPMHKSKYKSSIHLSVDYIFNDYWSLFFNIAVPRSNADKLTPIIKEKITHNDRITRTITYKVEDDKQPLANKKQEGDVTIKIGPSFGEARKNSITKFKLTCEKGIFIETNSKEIEFTGADYYFENHGGNNTYKTKYKTYDCNDYKDEEKEKDTFTLIQIQRMTEKIEEELIVEEVDFGCEKLYDIFATYQCSRLC